MYLIELEYEHWNYTNDSVRYDTREYLFNDMKGAVEFGYMIARKQKQFELYDEPNNIYLFKADEYNNYDVDPESNDRLSPSHVADDQYLVAWMDIHDNKKD